MGAEPTRPLLPDWPRLMSVEQAAAYVSLSTTTIRASGPKPKHFGKRVLYDRRDLDRWADRLGGQPLDAIERKLESRAVEARFLEKLRGRN